MASQESILENLKAFAICWMFSTLPLNHWYGLASPHLLLLFGTPASGGKNDWTCHPELMDTQWYSFHGRVHYRIWVTTLSACKLGILLSVRVTTGIWNEIIFLAGTESNPGSKRFTFHMGHMGEKSMPTSTPARICFCVILLFSANAIALQTASTVGSEAVEVGNHLQKYVRILTAMTWSTNMYIWLVVSTHLKNMLVKLDHFSKDRGENKKSLSCHHPDMYVSLYHWIYIYIDVKSGPTNISMKISYSQLYHAFGL